MLLSLNVDSTLKSGLNLNYTLHRHAQHGPHLLARGEELRLHGALGDIHLLSNVASCHILNETHAIYLGTSWRQSCHTVIHHAQGIMILCHALYMRVLEFHLILGILLHLMTEDATAEMILDLIGCDGKGKRLDGYLIDHTLKSHHLDEDILYEVLTFLSVAQTRSGEVYEFCVMNCIKVSNNLLLADNNSSLIIQ